MTASESGKSLTLDEKDRKSSYTASKLSDDLVEKEMKKFFNSI
jgi:hypothetical protein